MHRHPPPHPVLLVHASLGIYLGCWVFLKCHIPQVSRYSWLTQVSLPSLSQLNLLIFHSHITPYSTLNSLITITALVELSFSGDCVSSYGGGYVSPVLTAGSPVHARHGQYNSANTSEDVHDEMNEKFNVGVIRSCLILLKGMA